ncbi:MAG: glycosyl hydrolase family 65 protein [Gordonia sp. (in: high G+C Gram-positive bacteria)]
MATSELWEVAESGWDPARANYYETVFTVGNGRLGTRGSLEEGHRGAVSGTFLAGVYDAHDSQVIDLVNAPDWLDTEVYVDGVRLDTDTVDVLEHDRTLDLRTGTLSRRTVFGLGDARRFALTTERFADMSDRDRVGLRVRVTALDDAARVRIVSGLDAHRRNMEALPVYPEGTKFGYDRKWEKWARSTHLVESGRGFDGESGYVTTSTIDSGHEIAYAMSFAVFGAPSRIERSVRSEHVSCEFVFDAAVGAPVGVDKTVGIATSRDPWGAGSPLERALATARSADFDTALAASSSRWRELWEQSDLEIVGDDKAALAMRFSIYHLLIAANPDDPTVNIGAKSLSGEGYRGHVFWDTEIMMLPFFLFTQPGTARALLGYRHHTLPGAREVAAGGGDLGARYPWESADTGREECPIATPDGQFRFWTRDEELHVTGDVAFAIGRYVEVTGDHVYLRDEGAEILFDTARFWVSRCEADGDRLVIRKVMGPDEFHSHVDDNAFTNRLVRWHLDYAVATYDELAVEHPDRLEAIAAGLGLTRADRDAWADAATRLTAPVDPDCGLIEQFDGYFERKDVPIVEWDENDMPQYPPGYHHFNCEDTQLLKQPDVIQLLFQFPDDYSLATKRENYEYYEKRTLHKSSLSPSIHAIVGLQIGDSSMADEYFARSAYVDLDDNQGNTEDGMHIASAAGTWQIVVHGFAGFLAGADGLRFDPALPAGWERVRFRIAWRGRSVSADIGHDDAVFELIGDGLAETITVRGDAVELTPGEPVAVALTG